MSTPSFRVAVVGPSRVGKTTLVTAIFTDTEDLLAGRPVSVTMDEYTDGLVATQQKALRRAIEVGEFDAAALGGTQRVNRYRLALQAGGDAAVTIPFELLDYPGSWLDATYRRGIPEAVAEWPAYQEHVRESIMLLVPIDSAVLMEAVTPWQRAAAGDLLGLVDVERVGRDWAKHRAARPDEPAVLVLAPLKCEKYFDDNGGLRRDGARLRERVREKYEGLLRIVADETGERAEPVRVVYAPIDTYGCVELMEATWSGAHAHEPDFTARYRFRGDPPRITVRAAGTVMQELCRAVLAGQARVERDHHRAQQDVHDTRAARRDERKGFWGTIGYYLSGEADKVREDIGHTAKRLETIALRRTQLTEAAQRLASIDNDPRVEVWSGEDRR